MENEVGTAGECTPRFGLAVEADAAGVDEFALLDARVASYSGLSSVPTRTAIKWGERRGERGQRAQSGTEVRLLGLRTQVVAHLWMTTFLWRPPASCVWSELNLASPLLVDFTAHGSAHSDSRAHARLRPFASRPVIGPVADSNGPSAPTRGSPAGRLERVESRLVHPVLRRP